MDAQLFLKLKQVLPDYYKSGASADLVGYLRGSVDCAIWRQMEQQSRYQMLILGDKLPTQKDWEAAGVAHRTGVVQPVRLSDLSDSTSDFTILYGGFMVSDARTWRPWGKIVTTDQDVLTLGFPGSLNSWKSNYRRPGP